MSWSNQETSYPDCITRRSVLLRSMNDLESAVCLLVLSLGVVVTPETGKPKRLVYTGVHNRGSLNGHVSGMCVNLNKDKRQTNTELEDFHNELQQFYNSKIKSGLT